MRVRYQPGKFATSFVCSVLAAGLALMLGCASDEDDGLVPRDLPQEATEIAESSQAILNGNTPDSETISKGGFVALSYRRSDGSILFHCSGTLYTNSFLITAKHCVNSRGAAFLRTNPGALTVWLGRNSTNTQFQAGKHIWFPNSTNDYALIEVASPFLMPRNSDGVLSTSGYSRSFSSPANNSPVVCFGAGFNVQTCDASGSNCTGQGNGVLRWATLTAQVLNVGSAGIVHMMAKYKKNSSGQLQAEGDSGGSCVAPSRVFISMWKQPIVSINSTGGPEESFAELGGNAVGESWTLQ